LPLLNAKSNRWQNTVWTLIRSGVRVEPSQAYRFTSWMRAQGCSGKLVTGSHVYWYRADNSYIKHQGVGSVRDGETDWRCVSKALVVPVGAPADRQKGYVVFARDRS